MESLPFSLTFPTNNSCLMSSPEALEQFTLPSFDEDVESEEPGRPHRKPDVAPPPVPTGEVPEHLAKGKEFEAIQYFEGYDASYQESSHGSAFGELDTGEESYSDEEKQELASVFATDNFIRENSLLTDAEAFAKSIREGAQLYKQQLLLKTEKANLEAEQFKQEALTLKQTMEDERQAVLREAHLEADKVKEQGYQEGFDAGLQAGMEKRFQESEYLANQMNGVIEQLSNLRQVVRFQAEQELVQLAVLIAKQVVVQELMINPEMLQNILVKALREIESKGKIQVFLHPEDYEFMQNTGVNLDQYMGEEQTLVLKVNQEAEPGSIFIETDDDVLNFTFQQQFEQIEEELSQRLAERQVQMHSVDMDAYDFTVPEELQTAAGDSTVQGTEPEEQHVLTAPEEQENSMVAEETPESISGMKVEEELVDAVDTNAEIDPAELFGEPSQTETPTESDTVIDPNELFGNFDER